MTNKAHAEWSCAVGFGLILAAMLGGCWITKEHETERQRLEVERLKIVSGMKEAGQ